MKRYVLRAVAVLAAAAALAVIPACGGGGGGSSGKAKVAIVTNCLGGLIPGDLRPVVVATATARCADRLAS